MQVMRPLAAAFGAVLLLLAALCAYDTWWNDFSALDNYEVLRLSRSASSADIKRSFRELSLRYHPDKDNTELSVRRFHRISDAYQTLLNDETRQTYDERLREEERRRIFEDQGASIRLRPSPPAQDLLERLWFYLYQLPPIVLTLLPSLLSFRGFFTVLVVSGTVIFLVDTSSRFFSALKPSDAASSKEFKDFGLLAARARQQEALDAQPVVTKSKAKPKRSSKPTSLQ
ncbi:hypothetical protein Poli38472_005971 [Pythium oligandrum]|uniref:J domain-containing protein n=1 Tax=Pythium oligandrum TaxID=41045 RepID=A0A8K1FSF6_PYTOL|nr:hypothetical protein Poli38472_005971 [Pythium oligandrum]|eukprot:TMW68503.1 hypothetical protein Poli38472_005971 [Pythium oligandrum]